MKWQGLVLPARWAFVLLAVAIGEGMAQAADSESDRATLRGLPGV